MVRALGAYGKHGAGSCSLVADEDQRLHLLPYWVGSNLDLRSRDVTNN